MKDFPEDVERFLLETIDSVDLLEVLLLLRGDPARAWSAAEVGQALYTNPKAATERLADLEARRIIKGRSESERLYSYGPEKPELVAVIDRLADLYRERRVAVISLIYSKPQGRVQAFADAFRIRKEK